MNSSLDDKPQRAKYTGTFNMPLLSEELYAAFPSWIIPDPLYEFRGAGKVIATENGVMIVFPKATSKALVDAIVAAHDPTKPSKNEKDKKDKKKLRKDGKKKLKNLGITQAEVDAMIGAD